MKRTVVLCVLLVLAFVGCRKSVQQLNNEIAAVWYGRHTNDLMSVVGVPGQVLPDGSGGTIWVYKQTQYHNNTTYVPPAPVTTSNYAGSSFGGAFAQGMADGIARSMASGSATSTVSQSTQTAMFWVNESGTIYKSAYTVR